uniref:Uncharacterized protein n=1 Tax=Anguilla anguilla TaxID=7936 RepID=A0A0E9TAD8_ANGAN
MFNFDKPKI